MVSSVTVRVTVVDFPAASVAITVMVFSPSSSSTTVEKLPLEATVTCLPFTLTVTGLLTVSLLVPLTVRSGSLVM